MRNLRDDGNEQLTFIIFEIAGEWAEMCQWELIVLMSEAAYQGYWSFTEH